MSKKTEIPEDLQIEVALSKKEKFWANVKRVAENEIINANDSIELQEALIEISNKKIEEERQKQKV